jgi:putative MATE family efflux protein
MAEPYSDIPHSSLRESIKLAIRGGDQDYTSISVTRAVFLLSIPMVLEMAMESLFAIVDVFWVTRLGSDAVATVGLTESILALVVSVALGVSMATTAMVARRIGEKDSHGAAIAAVQAIALGIAVAIGAGVPGYFFGRNILELMGAPPALIESGHQYTSVMLGGCASLVLLFLNNAIFRGAGDPAIAMRVLCFSNLLNMILDPFLIFGWGPFPRMGVTGAGVATVIGRSAGVLYQFYLLANGSSRIRIALRDIRPAWGVMRSLLRVSATGVLQFAIGHTSWIALVRIISSFGSEAVAGYTIGIRIFIFALMPSWGLSGAAATMTGQNLGARRPERAERAVWLTGTYNMLILAVVAAVFIGVPEPIVRLFTTDPAVVPFAVDCLRIISFGNLGYAYGMVLVQAFNGAGDTVTPTIINIFGFWIFEIPLAWFLAFPAGFGVDGVYAAIPIAECLITVAGWMCFRRGTWKQRKI